MITPSIAFSRELLKLIDMQLSIGVVSFQSCAEIYNNLTPSSQSLNDERLEEAWYLYHILHFITKFEIWPRDIEARLDMETLCKLVYPLIRSKIDSQWQIVKW